MTGKTPAQQWADKQRRLAALKPSLAVFTICDDSSLRIRLADTKAELVDAEDKLAHLTEDQEPYRPRYEQRLQEARTAQEEAQAAFDAKAIQLTFKAVPRDQLRDLLAKHPPTDEQEAEGQEFADAFMPDLISAASVDGMPVDDARQYLETWQHADARDLWEAAWGVQHTKRTDLGKG
jgi:hypothetical protein